MSGSSQVDDLMAYADPAERMVALPLPLELVLQRSVVPDGLVTDLLPASVTGPPTGDPAGT